MLYTHTCDSTAGSKKIPSKPVCCPSALGPVVENIISLTSSLRGQLIKSFMTLIPNTMIFFVEKIEEAFALQKLLTFFQQKILAYLRYLNLKF